MRSTANIGERRSNDSSRGQGGHGGHGPSKKLKTTESRRVSVDGSYKRNAKQKQSISEIEGQEMRLGKRKWDYMQCNIDNCLCNNLSEEAAEDIFATIRDEECDPYFKSCFEQQDLFLLCTLSFKKPKGCL